MAAPTTAPLRRRVQLSAVMLALESFLSYERIFMVSVLQRLGVPVAMVSMPGAVSSLMGIFLIPLLGWASDRFTPNGFFGPKRAYAVLTLTLCTVGTTVLLGVTMASLYKEPLLIQNGYQAQNSASLPHTVSKYPYKKPLWIHQAQNSASLPHTVSKYPYKKPLWIHQAQNSASLPHTVSKYPHSHDNRNFLNTVEDVKSAGKDLDISSPAGRISSAQTKPVDVSSYGDSSKVPLNVSSSDRNTSSLNVSSVDGKLYGSSNTSSLNVSSLDGKLYGSSNTSSLNISSVDRPSHKGSNTTPLNVSSSGHSSFEGSKTSSLSSSSVDRPSYRGSTASLLNISLVDRSSYRSSNTSSLKVSLSRRSFYEANGDHTNGASNTSSPNVSTAGSPALAVVDNTSNIVTYFPVTGVLGIVGFVLADQGYDASLSTVKAFMISVTPATRQADSIVTGTLVGAIGGCATSLLGFVDLASLFPPERMGFVLDRWVAQCLVQTAIILLSLVVLGSCSLLASSDIPTPENQAGESSSGYSTDSNLSSASASSQDPVLPEHRTRGLLCTQVEASLREKCDEKTGLVPNSARHWKSVKRKVLLCLMAFLGLAANYAYFPYVANYVGRAIYGGVTHADAGSDAYGRYVDGQRVATLGMLVFYVLSVAYNMLHSNILKRIGMRAEYVGASLLCCVTMLALSVTGSLVVFFLNAAVMAMFRTTVYTIPFILANNYSQEEASKGTSVRSGSSMAAVTAMLPACYFVVSLIMGPLIEATGHAAAPIVFSSVSSALGIVCSCFVQF